MSEQDIIDGALRWIAKYLQDDPNADVQALSENIIRWRTAAIMGRTIRHDWDEFRTGVLVMRYGK